MREDHALMVIYKSGVVRRWGVGVLSLYGGCHRDHGRCGKLSGVARQLKRQHHDANAKQP
jgi:hypothetical protein